MSLFFYNVFLFLYLAGIRCYALFNRKAAKWIAGRKNWETTVHRALRDGEKRIWVHCSSLGEYEQGKPLIEALRSAHPTYIIVLTFFSPSGYEAYGQSPIADYVFYLPYDSSRNAKKFIDLVDPALTVFVKYEFWHYYLHRLKTLHKPVILISAAFRKEQPFFKWHGGFFRNMLHCFSYIFVQDHGSALLLNTIGITGNVMVAGDTRYDRVAAIARNFTELPVIEKYVSGHQVLVAGSTWPEDEVVLQQSCALLPPGWKFIIAPHDVNETHVSRLMQMWAGEAVLYSELSAGDTGYDKKVLIINNIGMLARLYAYGAIAFVGGGFAKGGVHNILEPAVFGLPVIFGPEYDKYIEAREMVDAQLAFPVSNVQQCSAQIKKLTADPKYRDRLHAAIKTFMNAHTGSTDKIMAVLNREFLE